MTDTEIRSGNMVAATPAPALKSPLSRLIPGASSPWPGRFAFVVLAVALFSLPSILTATADIELWGRWLCYAMVAVGLDIAWGYGGMLTMGQGVFFGLGAYAMAMHLKLENLPPGTKLPDFMTLYGNYTKLPLLWRPFQSFWFTAFAAVVIPALVATILGLLVFKRRIRGPFFAIVTQATAVIFALILAGNLKLTAGTNGLTEFRSVFGHKRARPDTKVWLLEIAAIGLLVVLAVAMVVVRSRFGKLLQAVRDSENRVRFLGYDPAIVKTIAFAISAAMAGLAGGIAAPVIGLVTPSDFAFVPSILMVCWVAVGGRGTLWGAVLGALLVNWTKDKVSTALPDQWLYFQGALFIVVLAFAPGGIAGVLRALKDRAVPLIGRFSKPSVVLGSSGPSEVPS